MSYDKNLAKNSFYDFRYAYRAKRMSAMVKKSPVSPEQLLVKWTEFVAEFKTLENLVGYFVDV